MKRCLGILAVLFLMFGMGALADSSAVPYTIAIEPTGPVSVQHTETSTTYTATVTCDTNFWLRLKVYINGTLKHDSLTYYPNSGPTKDVQKVVPFVGLQDGYVMVYRGRATIAGTGTYDEEDWEITVQ